MNAEYTVWLLTVRVDECRTLDVEMTAHSKWSAQAQYLRQHPGAQVLAARRRDRQPSEAAKPMSPKPLWERMHKAALLDPGYPGANQCTAAEIELLRDDLFPEEKTPHIPNPVDPAELAHWSIELALHRQRRTMRDYLTMQARVARETGPHPRVTKEHGRLNSWIKDAPDPGPD